MPVLVDHFLKEEGISRRFSSGAIHALQSHPWPGNVRQLRSAVLAMACTAEDDPIDVEYVRQYLQMAGGQSKSERFPALSERLAEAEREHIQQALELASGNKNEAIKLLGMARATFFERLKRYRL